MFFLSRSSLIIVQFFFMNCSCDINDNTNNNQYDLLDWDSTQTDAFLNTLTQKSHLFREITDKLATNDEIDVKNAIDNVSELIYNVSFQYFGTTVPFRKTAKKRRHCGLMIIVNQPKQIS